MAISLDLDRPALQAADLSEHFLQMCSTFVSQSRGQVFWHGLNSEQNVYPWVTDLLLRCFILGLIYIIGNFFSWR